MQQFVDAKFAVLVNVAGDAELSIAGTVQKCQLL